MIRSQGVDRLVFFTTDAGYLVPTLVAALQVHKQASVGPVADVALFLVGLDETTIDALRAAFPMLAFHDQKPESFALPPAAIYNKTHVPRSALARLVVGAQIELRYEHLVYLDGDIQIVGDIAPLLKFDVPVGQLLAAPDVAEIVWCERGTFAEGFRSYVRGLGIERPTDYFNSGVLAARRETWRRLGQAAFDFMSEHSDLCRFHDQSALNKVARQQRLALSPRYNLISAYQQLVESPRNCASILHFSGGVKPWREAADAIEPEFLHIYKDLVAQHDVLGRFWETTSGRHECTAGQHSPRSWQGPLRLWRSVSRRYRFRRWIVQAASDASVTA